MSDRHGSGGRLSRLPLDAVLVVGVLALAAGLSLLPPASPLRVLLALPALFLLPGYGLALAVFPARRTERRGRGSVREVAARAAGGGPAGLDVVERLALSFGLSVFLLPVLALALSLAGVAFTALTVLPAVGGFALAALGVGHYRRSRLPRNRRYLPTVGDAAAAVGMLGAGEGVDRALNVALVVAVVGASAGLGLGIAAPQDGSSFTQVSLLTEDLEGDLSASDYPTELAVDESAELVLSVQNREGEPTAYTAVVQVQQVGPNGSVTERTELTRFEREVLPGMTWRARHDLRIPTAGEDQRVIYLLYRGEAPAEPTLENAYRHVYFWTDVSPV